MPCFFQHFMVIAVMVMVIGFPSSARTAGAGDTPATPSETIDDPGFYYTIQKGDTLWDLSQKFYNSQWVWPGLWEINDQVKNPHRIYPGQRIRVYLDPTHTAPESGASPLVEPQPKPLEVPAEPVREALPTLFYSGMDHIGFIRETAVEPAGRILKSDDNETMITEGYHIFLEPMGAEALIPNRLYAVYATEPIKQKQKTRPPFKGLKHTIKGIIRILENNHSFATGTVLTSFSDMTSGDLVMPFIPPARDIPVEPSLENLHARILCQDDIGILMSDYSIAFINKGSRDNVKPGQIYTLFREQKPTISATRKIGIQLPPLPIGKLVILRVDDIASTVLVLSSTREITPNTLVN